MRFPRHVAILAALGVALLVSGALAQERVLVNNKTIPAGVGLWPGVGADSTEVLPNRGGMLFLVATFADSVQADSAAIEVLPLVGTRRAVGGFRMWGSVDLNTSNGAKLDGWFCTTLDSTALITPGNLTPLAVTGPHFPHRVSSIVVPGQYLMPAGSMGLPGGAMGAQFGFGTQDAVDRTRRVWALPVSDGFGVTLDGMVRLSVAVINRHPRNSLTLSSYYVASAR